MVVNQDDQDDSTICTVITPPETVAIDPLNDRDVFGRAEPSFFLVPWPGSTFIILCITSGRVITLLGGKITLTPPGGRGSIYWECVETGGWLGFRDTVSGMFLGHDANRNLRCSAKLHLPWEYFNVRMKPDGGCVLLMTHFDKLWHVGVKTESGVEKLAKIAEGGSGGIAWEFVKV